MIKLMFSLLGWGWGGRVATAPRGHAGTVPPTQPMGRSTSWAQIPSKPMDAETPHENPEQHADPRDQAWKMQPTLPFLPAWVIED